MKIFLTPHDIIERCLWDDFDTYILDKSVDRKELIEKNEEFEIKENDALVIGLLKCVETNNLSHKLNQHVMHYLSNKSFTHTPAENKPTKYYVKRRLLLEHIESFKNKFPGEWKPSKYYSDPLEKMYEYMEVLIGNINELSTVDYSDNYGDYKLVEFNHVKKALKFNT